MDEAKELKISHDISNKCDNLIFRKTKYRKLCSTIKTAILHRNVCMLEQHVDIIFNVSLFLLRVLMNM